MNSTGNFPSRNGVQPGRFAFTLLELLALVVIVCILAGFMLVAVAHSTDQSSRAVCRNNLRQVYVATCMYASDYGDKPLPAKAAAGIWAQVALAPFPWSAAPTIGFTNKDSVWTCPNRPGFPSFNPTLVQWTLGYQYFGGIRTWNNPAGSFESRSPIRFTQSQPHWTLAADATMKINGEWGGNEPDVITYSNMPPHHAADSLTPQGGNHVFMDGSAHWVPFERMYFLTSWHNQLRIAYFYQDPRDFPTNLLAALPNLRAKP